MIIDISILNIGRFNHSFFWGGGGGGEDGSQMTKLSLESLDTFHQHSENQMMTMRLGLVWKLCEN